jgi:ubiquitin C-terminal hydrolase
VYGSKVSVKQGAAKASKEEPNTVVKEIFGGLLQSQVKCLSCNTESNKIDDIMDLSLDIVRLGSLSEALCRFFQPEVLDGENKYRCDQYVQSPTSRFSFLFSEALELYVACVSVISLGIDIMHMEEVF